MAYFTAKDNESRALLLNCPVSRKFGNEFGKFITGKSYTKAMEYIEAVMEKKRYLPLVRFNDDVGHRPGMEGVSKSGRYPIKLASYLKKALQLARSNAENKGLDGEDLVVVGCVVNTGVRRVNVQPGGRRRMRRSKSAHIEVLLRQRHKLKPKDAKKEAPKVEAKAEKEVKKEDVKVEVKKEVKVETTKKEVIKEKDTKVETKEVPKKETTKKEELKKN